MANEKTSPLMDEHLKCRGWKEEVGSLLYRGLSQTRMTKECQESELCFEQMGGTTSQRPPVMLCWTQPVIFKAGFKTPVAA